MSCLDIIYNERNVTGIVATKLWLKSGSGLDPIHKKGLHQLYGSLLTRGCGPYSNINIADLVEGCGAGLRCDTFEDGLLISLKCINNDFRQLAPVIGWMIEEPHLQTSQFNLEKELTLLALKRQKENPFHQAFDKWRKLVYGDGPYGHDPLGLRDDIESLKRKDLLPIGKQIRAKPKIISISGYDSNSLKDYIESQEPFINWKKTIPDKNKLNKHKKVNSLLLRDPEERVCFNEQSTEQIVILLGQQTVPYSSPDDINLRLISTHLGGGMSSVLFKKLREENGLAYDVGIHYPIREGNAPFILHASTTHEKAIITLKLLINALMKIFEEELSEEELLLSKSKFKGYMAHGSQTASQVAERRAQLRSLQLGDDYDDKLFNAIEGITSKQLQETAIRNLSKPYLSLCGPKESIENLVEYWSTANI